MLYSIFVLRKFKCKVYISKKKKFFLYLDLDILKLLYPHGKKYT